MAAIAYSDASSRSSYSSSAAYGFSSDAFLRSLTPVKTHPRSYPAGSLYIKYIRRVWKRVSRATRKPERASVLPDGFVLINNARLNLNAAAAASRRKSAMLL